MRIPSVWSCIFGQALVTSGGQPPNRHLRHDGFCSSRADRGEAAELLHLHAIVEEDPRVLARTVVEANDAVPPGVGDEDAAAPVRGTPLIPRNWVSVVMPDDPKPPADGPMAHAIRPLPSDDEGPSGR
jgi:hypothetical protein